LFAAYKDVNPELAKTAESMLRKLADGLYERGARAQIGMHSPPKFLHIHQSLDPLGNVVWTCHRWTEVMGYANRAAIGHHISEFISEDSFQMFKEFAWPQLIREGSVSGVPLTYVRSTKELVPALLQKSEIMRDSEGAFHRTFAKIRVTIHGYLAVGRLACLAAIAAACFPVNHSQRFNLGATTNDLRPATIGYEVKGLPGTLRGALDSARLAVEAHHGTHVAMPYHYAGSAAVRQLEPALGCEVRDLHRTPSAPRRRHFG
jgi:hypothetical protein